MGPGGRAFVLLQWLLPQHLVTAAVHWLARREAPWLRRALVRGFMRLFPIDMHEASEPDPDRYVTFNDFFTRALRDDARPLAAAGTIACPCDGRVSQRGTIDDDRVLQARLAAKHRWYTLAELLAGDADAAAFAGGEFATIYLAPFNYHRVHMPLDGRLRSVRYVPGNLFSVNATAAAGVRGLFARNERVVCRFDTALGALAVVFVGALNVGSIRIEGYGDLTPARPRRARLIVPPQPVAMQRGAELGRFNMGSTIILLLPRGSVRWSDEFVPGATVRMGTAIGRPAPAG